MYLDALILAIISTTPVHFRNDCEEVTETAHAYHRVVDHWNDSDPDTILYKDSHINLCKDKRGNNWNTMTHEIGHELHHRIRQDEEYEKYVYAWDTISAMSDPEDRSDYVSSYAMKNVNEDFADTFKHWYLQNGKVLVDPEEPDWLTPKQSRIVIAKYQLMELIIEKYTNSLTQ